MLQNYSLKTVHEILLIDENKKATQGLKDLLRQNKTVRLLHHSNLTDGLLALSEHKAVTAIFLAAPAEKLQRYVAHIRKQFANTTLIVLTDVENTSEVNAIQHLIQDHILVANLEKATLDRVLRFAQERNRLIRQMDEGRHELRTPITAINGLCDLLLESEKDPERRTYLRSIRESSDLLLAVSKTLHPDAKTILESQPQVFDLEETLGNLMHIMRTNMEEQRVHLYHRILPEVPTHLEGDPVLLKQILINVLGNAIKFTGEGEVKLLVDTVPTEPEDDRIWLRFTVTDTGVGIPEEIQELIFQTYHRADNDIPGNGLGLAIVRRLVEEQGGTIQVRSKLGIGSTFDIQLPFRESVASVKKKLTLRPIKSNPIDLLLVEDHAINQLVTRHILEKELRHVRVTTASNGREALQILQQQTFQIVLLDLQMPVLDGYETIRRLRQTDNAMPVLAMTAHDDFGSDARFTEWGFTDYILKPFEPKELVQKIACYVKTESMSPNVYAHIDLSYLDLMADGDSQLRRLMLELLTKEMPSDFEKYQPLYEKRDWKELHRISHKMKTTLSFVGNEKLTRLNARIERIVKTRTDLGKLPDLLQQVQELYPKALEEVREELAEE